MRSLGLNTHGGGDIVVCKVVRSDVRLSEDALLGRMAMLKGAKAAAKLAERWKGLREAGMDCAVARRGGQARRRLCMVLDGRA